MNKIRYFYRIPVRHLFRPHLCLLVLCALGLAVPNFHAQQTAASSGPPANMNLYLLIGGANMAGPAEIPQDAGDIIDRCYLLNDKNEWEPARNPLNRYSSVTQDSAIQKLGPGYSFARKMLEAEQGHLHRPDRQRTAATRRSTTGSASPSLTGAPASAPRRPCGTAPSKACSGIREKATVAAADGYLEKLQTLIGNLRSDFNDPNLPFIAGQIHDGPAINAQIAKLPETAHATAFVSSEGLTATDGTHFDTKSQLLLGERYAEQMIRLQASLSASAPKPPSDIKFIDPHVHAMSVTPLGLRAVAKWMEERNVERCIVSPLSHKGSRPQNEEERETMLANFRPYKGRIDRMASSIPARCRPSMRPSRFSNARSPMARSPSANTTASG